MTTLDTPTTDRWMLTHAGDNCNNCDSTYRACNIRIFERRTTACCGTCQSTGTHNERTLPSIDPGKRNLDALEAAHNGLSPHQRRTFDGLLLGALTTKVDPEIWDQLLENVASWTSS